MEDHIESYFAMLDQGIGTYLHLPEGMDEPRLINVIEQDK